MNQTKKRNRAKKLRINAAKHGFNGKPGITKNDIVIMAMNKTPKTQRVANYYTQTKNFVQGEIEGVGNVYYKTESINKIISRKHPKPIGIFDVMEMIKKLFSFGNKTAAV